MIKYFKLFVFIFLVSIMFIMISCVKNVDKETNNSNTNNEPEQTDVTDNNEEETKEYVIKFSPDNGRAIKDVKFEENSFPELPVPEKKHFVFVGWFEGDIKVERITENKDYNLVAKWDKEVYTINFYNGDELIETKEYAYSDPVTYPVAEDYEDDDFYYEFVSWSENINVALEDKDITATYNKIKLCNISIKFNGKEIYSKKLKEYSKIKDIDISSMNDDNYIYSIDSLYQDEELNHRFTEHYIKEDLYLFAKVLTKPKRSTYENMTISFLGDSISTFYKEGSPMNSYYSGENTFYYPIYSATVKKVEDTWWALLMTKLNLKFGINNSWSGSACYNNGNEKNSGAMNYGRINTLGENGTPDIIITFIGTNDLGNGYSDYELKSSYNTMLKRIHEKYPNAYIFCITLAYTGNTVYSYNEEGRIKYNEIIRSTALKNNAFVIDWANTQDNETAKSYLGDALHYNKLGMEKLSEVVANRIKEFFETGIVR